MEVDPIALIVAITGLASVVTGMLAKFIPKLRQLDESVKATDGWVLENEEKLKGTAIVVQKLSPEAKAILERYGASVEQLTSDVNLVKDELAKYHNEVPASETKDFDKASRDAL